MNRFLVVGGGSWGTALVKILLQNSEHKVDWWVRSESIADHINSTGSNPKYLRSVKFDTERLHASTDLVGLIDANDIILLVTPSAFLHETLGPVDNQLLRSKMIISAIKGVVPQTLQIVGEYLFTEKQIKMDHFGVITGPCHAEEVAQKKLSYLTFASTNEEFANRMSESFTCSFIRTTASPDIYGTEISAVLKNVYAIASGMCHSLGYGDNFQAVLVSNAIREINRFIEAVHPIDRDTFGSAYLGDLLVTAYSTYSRNRTLGAMLGKGYSVRSALMEMEMVAEGYYAAKTIYDLNERFGIEMPIMEYVHDVIYENASASSRLRELCLKLN